MSLLGGDDVTAKALPPEFVAFGITKENYKPWSPVDSLAAARLMGLAMSHNFMEDLKRDVMRHQHPELESMVEELLPYSSDKFVDMIPVVDDEDLPLALRSKDGVSIVDRYL